MSFADVCVKRPLFATMLVMALVVVGWLPYDRLGLDLLRQTDRSTISLTTPLAGASPKIENAILQEDYTDVLWDRWLERYDAILKADHAPLRPIIIALVSLATPASPSVVPRQDADRTVCRKRHDGLLIRL